MGLLGASAKVGGCGGRNAWTQSQRWDGMDAEEMGSWVERGE